MSNSSHHPSAQLALLCDRDGVVQHWLHDGIGASEVHPENCTFVRLLHESNQVKGLNFLSTLTGKRVAADWDLCFAVPGGGIEVLHVAGSWCDKGALVLAGNATSSLQSLCNDVRELHPDVASACDKIAAEFQADEKIDDTAVYAQLMQMYNDFARMQREFASQNAKLIRLADEKEDMLNIAVHDLRSPLNAISLLASSVEQLAQDRLTDREVSLLNRIVDTAGEMGTTVTRILDDAKHDPSGPVVEFVPGDMHALVAARIELLGALATRKSIEIKLLCEDELPPIPFDRTHMPHVVDNVLGNAIKFSPTGGDVEIHLHKNGDEMVLEFCDRGEGIPAGEDKLIFNSFETGSVRPTDGEASNGLGLAICRSIVAAHNGTIVADNRDGGGAVFRITLPLRQQGLRASKI